MAMFSEELPDDLLPYKGRLTPRFYEARRKVLQFLEEDVYPALPQWHAQRKALEDAAVHPTQADVPAMHWELMRKAKARGLFNFFLPEVCGLSVLEYAPIQEILGTCTPANMAMNCTAPDTGNMEVLEKYGTAAQKEKWLKPLLAGEMRSCFAMTEPGVASSDATNISTTITRSGGSYLINGHKWYISGAIRPSCKVAILMGQTAASGPIHKRHSMILVPMDAPGISILRPMAVFGHEHDHAEIIFDNVRVPQGNLILGEGRGFEVAQGRLGPGRIHHCMRTIGTAEAALGAMVHRAKNRTAFGGLLADKDTLRERIAEARLELTMARQLCYLAAVVADEKGFKAARAHIGMIKVAAPRVALKIIDEAMQVHGAHGISQDSKLSEMYTHVRHVRLADGPDIVHMRTIAKEELKRPATTAAIEASGVNENIKKYGYFEKARL